MHERVKGQGQIRELGSIDLWNLWKRLTFKLKSCLLDTCISMKRTAPSGGGFRQALLTPLPNEE